MERNASAIAAVGMVLAVVAAVPVTGLAATDAPGSEPGVGPGDAPIAADEYVENDSENASNESVGPGAMLSGVVGVQRAEIEGEVAERAFGVRLANATSNASKAGVVAEQLERIQDRLAELREEKAQLEQARENGSLSQGQYKARIAALNTKIRSVERLTNRTESATRGIPGDVLREKGVNVTAIRTLRENASELSGPEVAAIARQIAGPDAGKSLGKGPGKAGPPGRNGSAGGPPDRNGSAGGPPADAGNQSSGNETRGGPGDRGGNDSTPADGAKNSTDRGANGSAGGNGTSEAGNDTTPTEDDESDSDSGSGASEAGTSESVERSRS